MSEAKNRNRQPSGVPVGGEFAKEAGASTGLALSTGPVPVELEIGTSVQIIRQASSPIPAFTSDHGEVREWFETNSDTGEMQLYVQIGDQDAYVGWLAPGGDHGDNVAEFAEGPGDLPEEEIQQLRIYARAVLDNLDSARSQVDHAIYTSQGVQDLLLAAAHGRDLNAERAETTAPSVLDAERGAAAVRMVTGAENIEDDPETAAADTMAALIHWMNANDIDPEDVFGRAQRYSLEDDDDFNAVQADGAR